MSLSEAIQQHCVVERITGGFAVSISDAVFVALIATIIIYILFRKGKK